MCTHDKENIFHRHDDQKRPQQQGKNAENIADAGMYAMVVAEGLLHGIKRAGADIAIDDADGADHQAIISFALGGSSGVGVHLHDFLCTIHDQV